MRVIIRQDVEYDHVRTRTHDLPTEENMSVYSDGLPIGHDRIRTPSGVSQLLQERSDVGRQHVVSL